MNPMLSRPESSASVEKAERAGEKLRADWKPLERKLGKLVADPASVLGTGQPDHLDASRKRAAPSPRPWPTLVPDLVVAFRRPHGPLSVEVEARKEIPAAVE